jgi:hypothetical protein
MAKPQSEKVEVVQVDWLKPGWVFAWRKDACDATRFDVPRGDSPIFARAVLARLEQLKHTENVRGVFLSKEDCSVVTEHFPDVFYKNQN